MAKAKSRLHELAARGQSVWFDTLSRDLVHSGELKRMINDDAVTGVTSNPTIFQKALSQGDAYDEDLKELLTETDDPTKIFFSLALQDIREACDVLRPAYDASGGIDGYVSMEVEPGIAYDTEQTFAQARWIATEVDRPNLYVKIPATEPGLPAIEDCTAHGTSINITLIFSLDRFKAVVEAYIRGLERLVAGGGDPSKVVSVASFFVSRVDTEADKRLDAVGHPELKGKLAVANAKLAYKHFLEAFSGPRWAYLEGKGANKQRCLWASTSTKNPDYRDVIYVEELIGPDTVNTMPLDTIEAFQDHGEVRGDTVLKGVKKAQELLTKLAEAGVDYDDVTLTLEAEGVQKFSDSFDEIVESIRAKRASLAAA
jgi:transaldolase